MTAAYPHPHSLSVLVVEDNAPSRLLLRDLLEVRGHRVEEATDVPYARAALLAMHFDLVLLDIGLPGETGERLLAELRADPRWASMPVVAVTAAAMSGDRERLLSLGFDAYVSKPIEVRTFGQTVEAVAERRARA